LNTDDRITASRRIKASASDIFETISSPQGQVDIDGSGMLIGSTRVQPLTAVGDTFEINMDREPLGDVPLGKYTVTNTVTRIETDRRLEWNVAFGDMAPIGHVYGYLLETIGDRQTEVLSYCDWSSIDEEWRGHLNFPIVPVEMLEKSHSRISIESLLSLLRQRGDFAPRKWAFPTVLQQKASLRQGCPGNYSRKTARGCLRPKGGQWAFRASSSQGSLN
jgi:hypothetical protein